MNSLEGLGLGVLILDTGYMLSSPSAYQSLHFSGENGDQR